MWGPSNDGLEQTKRFDGRALEWSCVINVRFAAQPTVRWKRNWRTMEPKAPHEDDAENRYDELLTQLRHLAPRVAEHLVRAHTNRTRQLDTYLNADALREHFPGTYFAGFDEIADVLDAVKKAFDQSSRLMDIAFLVTRVGKDFASAIDAALSGFNGVVLDTMRDVMEVEYLFRDFSNDSSRISMWLEADRSILLREFSPSALRRRIADAAGKRPQDLPDAFEYRLHSEGLHVSPSFILSDLAGKGFADVPSRRATEFAFAEMFEHARRFLLAANSLGATAAGSAWTGPDVRTAMPEAAKAWERTQAMVAVLARFEHGSQKEDST